MLDDASETYIADFGRSKFVEVGASLLQSIDGGNAKDIMALEIDETKARLADQLRPIP
jgi:hypothetical protein